MNSRRRLYSYLSTSGRPTFAATLSIVATISYIVCSAQVMLVFSSKASAGEPGSMTTPYNGYLLSTQISLIAATSQSVTPAPDIDPPVDTPRPILTGQWFSGESDTTTVQNGSFANWRGRSIEIGGTWAAYDSLDHLVSSPSWSLAPGAPFADTPRIDFAAGGPLKGETWTEAASGAFDNRWTQQLRSLRTAWGTRPASNMFIRFAHEMNGNWFSWSVPPGDAGNFIAAWHRFYNLIQINFPGAQLVWAPNDQTSWSYDPRILWPGDTYVNVVGVDSYNWYPWVNSQEAFAAKMNATTSQGGPIGLESWRKFALSHTKPFAIPEWANASVSNGGGGGDAPIFVTLFHQWLVANGGAGPGTILYEILFNVKGYPEHYELFANGLPSPLEPLTADVYKALW